MRLSSLTNIAFQTNAIIDQHPHLEFRFGEIHEFMQAECCIQRLDERFGDKSDFSLFLADNRETYEVNRAMAAASAALQGAELGKAGVNASGLCLVVAIVLEAIQQQFILPAAQPEPALAEGQPF